MTEDILEIALKIMTLALNELVLECTDDDGKPKAPTKQDLMHARALLPAYCSQSLIKEKQCA